jgi:hypothetical protein
VLAGVDRGELDEARLDWLEADRMIAGELAGCPVLTIPSTFIQAKPSFGSEKLEFAAQPPGFAVHAFLEGELISQVQAVG